MTGERCDESVMTFGQAAGWLEQRFGRRPNVATIWRWATKGIRGVRLQTLSLGRYRYTNKRALEQFIAETSAAMSGRHGTASPAELVPVAERQGFTASEHATARRRREAEKEKAKAFLRQNLGSNRRGGSKAGAGP